MRLLAIALAALIFGCGDDSPEPYERFNTSPCDGPCGPSTTGAAGGAPLVSDAGADAEAAPQLDAAVPEAAVPDAAECTPNEVVNCTCADRLTGGIKTCAPTGTFGSCGPCG